MFITGLVLVLTYYPRTSWTLTFWRKRFFLIAIPYVVWTAAYMLFKGLYYPLQGYWSVHNLEKTFTHSITTGYQYYLYYLFVTMQLYVVFPLLVKGLQKFRQYHLHIFIASFLFQLGLMYLCKFVIPHVPLDSLPPVLATLDKYRESFVVTYQFWFVAGGIIACHYDAVVHFIQRHAVALMITLPMSVIAVWGHYFLDRIILHESEGSAQMVVQPIMIPYSLIVTMGILYVGCLWTRQRVHPAWKALTRTVFITSNASFGILLFQPILIVLAESVVHFFDQAGASKWVHYGLWPVSILFVYIGAAILSHWVGKIPYVSYVVGRKTSLWKSAKQHAVSA